MHGICKGWSKLCKGNLWQHWCVCLINSIFVWQGCKSKVLMEDCNTSWSLIDINDTWWYGSRSLSSSKTFEGVFIVPVKHKVYVCLCSSTEVVSSPIDASAFSGCNSVPKLYGTEKKIAIKHLKDQILSLSCLEDAAASLANVYAKSTKFVSSCHGIKNKNNSSAVGSSARGKWTGNKLTHQPHSWCSYLLLQSSSFYSISYMITIKLAFGTVVCSQNLRKRTSVC